MYSRSLLLIVAILLVSTAIATGQAWTLLDSTTSPVRLNDISFVDTLNGWVGGDSGIVMRTTDGGVNWITLTPSGPLHVSKIEFCDRNSGYVSLVQTEWRDTIPPCPPRIASRLLKTSDGGLTWDTLFFADTLTPITDFSILNCDTLFISAGQTFRSYNGGLTLDTLSQNSEMVCVPISSVVYCTWGNNVYLSRDLGAVWEVQSILIAWANGIWPTNEGNVIVGSNYFPPRERDYRTTDLGVTWDTLEISNADGVHFCPSGFGLSINSRISDDFGLSWVDTYSGIRITAVSTPPAFCRTWGIDGRSIWVNNMDYRIYELSGDIVSLTGRPLANICIDADCRIHTDSLGRWSIPSIERDVTLNPHCSWGYVFDPAETTIHVDRDITGVRFIGGPMSIDLRGQLLTDSGSPIYGTRVQIDSFGYATTNSAGWFQLFIHPGHRRIVPLSNLFCFSPAFVDTFIDERIDYLHFTGCPSTNLLVTFEIGVGWNLISTPVASCDSAFFSTDPFLSAIWGYNPSTRTYVRLAEHEITPGQGIWALSSSPYTVTTSGPILTEVAYDIPVAGWALCGTPTYGTRVESITSEPPGRLVPGSVCTFSPAGGYTTLTSGPIPAGSAFWILVSDSCRIFIR